MLLSKYREVGKSAIIERDFFNSTLKMIKKLHRLLNLTQIKEANIFLANEIKQTDIFLGLIIVDLYLFQSNISMSLI